MSNKSVRPTRNRIVIETSQHQQRSAARSRKAQSGTGAREGVVALSVIAAAAVATFAALFVTSRPFNPMDASVAPQLTVPQGPIVSLSPKPSPALTPTPRPNQTVQPQQTTGEAAPDDATIHSEVEKKLEADPVLSQFDISTLVESGNVKIMGSVTSTTLKQQVERAIRSVKGVNGVDNQLVISEATP